MADWFDVDEPMEPIRHRATSDGVGQDRLRQMDELLKGLLFVLRSATGSDEHLDRRVIEYLRTLSVHVPDDVRSAPGVTSSLDSALLLLPPAWCWDVGRMLGSDEMYYAKVSYPDGTSTDQVRALTPALALCSAALFAHLRDHQAGRGTDRALHLVKDDES